MKTVFKGAATALITPFDEGGVDFESFGKLIDWQIWEGIDALVVCGTTGESSTLSHEEHEKVLDFAVKRIAGRVPAIAGTGTNDTARAIELTKHACFLGYDATLMVTPYYNKATQNGLIKMFTAIADESSVPMILYNVPSRTGVNIEPTTYLALSDHPMIQGIKEAGGNISKAAETMSLVGDRLDLYSGNDDQIVPILSLGGKGVISVLSGIIPKKTAEMCRLFFEGRTEESLRLQLEYMPLIKALFSEVNPIPIKAASAKMGLCKNILRLPLTEMEEENAEGLYTLMRENKLIN
ncbi:MAG: 4-hydroxy-tetrahydrodipicolinate synthase [Clostridia bacterium]|nr:4-hydroxy-tetrahydrodipicolinate synthase [Clostridia bacterium]